MRQATTTAPGAPVMTTADETVLGFIGREGQAPEAIAQHFPGFDVTRLTRAQLVEIVARRQAETEVHAHASRAAEEWCVLTPRGAEAVGLDVD